MMDWPDHLGADRFSAPGGQPVMLVDAATHRAPGVAVQAVIIGCDEAGRLPAVDPSLFDILVTHAANPPAPWVEVADFAALAQIVAQWPVAATTLAQVLRLGERLAFDDALSTESWAYSTLLGSAAFQHWRESNSDRTMGQDPVDLILIGRDEDHVTLTLNDPDRRNAMTGAMRDALYSALASTLDDPTVPRVSLRAAGKCFSAGGHRGEFGTATDLASAHLIRMVHSCTRAIAALGARADVHFHGACIGSGLEIPMAAAKRTAAPDAWFQLPELRMGLIPGAGGTVTIGRAIGRHRTFWMVLSGKRLAVRQALDWGLIHQIVEQP